MASLARIGNGTAAKGKDTSNFFRKSEIAGLVAIGAYGGYQAKEALSEDQTNYGRAMQESGNAAIGMAVYLKTRSTFDLASKLVTPVSATMGTVVRALRWVAPVTVVTGAALSMIGTIKDSASVDNQLVRISSRMRGPLPMGDIKRTAISEDNKRRQLNRISKAHLYQRDGVLTNEAMIMAGAF